MSFPVVTFCPYLPLDREITLGSWRVGPLHKFEGPWCSTRFEELSKTLIRAHEPGNPALVYHAKHGAHGRPPRRDVLERIQTILNLGVLSNNPAWGPDVDGHFVATADNAEVVVWPIDVATAYVSTREGFVVRALTGGYKIDEDLSIKRPDGLRIPLLGVRLDDDELYSSFWQFLGRKSELASKIRVAIRWLSKAWLNTAAVDIGDRFVFIKTGFEALLGSSRNPEASELLRELFESTYQNAEEWELDGLLWRPSEKRNIKWRKQHWKPGRYEQATPLQHWFLAFSEERNRVIHEGNAPRRDYKRRTRYRGPHFFTASRVLLEAIRSAAGKAVGKQLALPASVRGQRELWEKYTKRITAKQGQAHHK